MFAKLTSRYDADELKSAGACMVISQRMRVSLKYASRAAAFSTSYNLFLAEADEIFTAALITRCQP